MFVGGILLFAKFSAKILNFARKNQDSGIGKVGGCDIDILKAAYITRVGPKTISHFKPF